MAINWNKLDHLCKPDEKNCKLNALARFLKIEGGKTSQQQGIIKLLKHVNVSFALFINDALRPKHITINNNKCSFSFLSHGLHSASIG